MTLHVGTTGPPIRANSMEPEVLRQIVQSIVTTAGIVNATDLAVVQNGTPNMSVNVGAGFAFIKGTSQSGVQGFYHAYNDGTVNLGIAASDPTNPRIDLVSLNINDAFYTGASNTAALVVTTGTPNASPVVPATPVSALPLAQVRVNANVTTVVTSNITDVRTTATMRGTSIATSATRPGTPRTGDEVFETDTAGFSVYDGTQWRPIPNGQLYGRQSPGIVGTPPAAATGRFLMQCGSQPYTTDSAGNFNVTYPVAFPNGVVMVTANQGDVTGNYIIAIVNGAQSASVCAMNAKIANTGAALVSSSVRVNWIAIGW